MAKPGKAKADKAKAAQKPMTSEEYAAAKGIKCPYCRSEDTTSEGLDADGDLARATVACNKCGKSWTDEFTLTGYSPGEEE